MPRVQRHARSTETIGVGKGIVTLEDISEHAELIIIVGQNPGTNHPRMLTALERAKRRGGRIVVVNPLPEAGFGRFHNPQTPRGLAGPGTQLADRLLPVRVNGDLALFAGLAKVLLALEDEAPGTVLDHDFIDAYTDGFDADRRGLAGARLAHRRGSERPHPGPDRGSSPPTSSPPGASSSAGPWA